MQKVGFWILQVLQKQLGHGEAESSKAFCCSKTSIVDTLMDLWSLGRLNFQSEDLVLPVPSVPSLWAKHGTTHKLISEKCIFYDWSCPLSIRSWDTLTYSTYQLNPIDVLLQYQCHDPEPAPCSQVYCNLLSSNVVHTVADREVRRKVGLKENAQTSGPRCLKMGLSNVWNSHCFSLLNTVPHFPGKNGSSQNLIDNRFTIKTC